MATAENTLLSRAEFTTVSNATTKRFAIVADGVTIDLGATGRRDVSASLQNVTVVTAGSLVVQRRGYVVTYDVSVTPSAAGNVQITKAGQNLPAQLAPDVTLCVQGRGGAVGVSTAGHVYINPAVVGQKVDATITFITDSTWPAALPGVVLGDPIVL